MTSHSVEVTVCFWTGTTHFATKAKMGLQQFYLATFGLILMQGKLIVRVLLMFCACYLLDVDFVRISPVNSTHRSIQGWRHVFGGNPIIRFWLLWNREWNIWRKKNNQERQKNWTTYSLTLDPCRWPIHVLILLSIYLCVEKFRYPFSHYGIQ